MLMGISRLSGLWRAYPFTASVTVFQSIPVVRRRISLYYDGYSFTLRQCSVDVVPTEIQHPSGKQ